MTQELRDFNWYATNRLITTLGGADILLVLHSGVVSAIAVSDVAKVGGIEACVFGSTVTLDCNNFDWHALTLTGDCTVLLSGGYDGQITEFYVTQGSGGNHHISAWDTSIDWGDAGPPLLSTVAGKLDMITLVRQASGKVRGIFTGRGYIA